MSPDAWEIHEGRFIQETLAASAAGDLFVYTDIVPNGVVRTFLSATYKPSVAETKTIIWYVYGRAGMLHALKEPTTIALSSSITYPLLVQGNEIKLFPGERLWVTRDSATAGSGIYIYSRFVDSDLPFYSRVEPLKKVVNSQRAHVQSRISTAYGGTGAGAFVGGGHDLPGGGKSGGPEPI